MFSFSVVELQGELSAVLSQKLLFGFALQLIADQKRHLLRQRAFT
jgi:hypothetical protein